MKRFRPAACQPMFITAVKKKKMMMVVMMMMMILIVVVIRIRMLMMMLLLLLLMMVVIMTMIVMMMRLMVMMTTTTIQMMMMVVVVTMMQKMGILVDCGYDRRPSATLECDHPHRHLLCHPHGSCCHASQGKLHHIRLTCEHFGVSEENVLLLDDKNGNHR